MPRLTESDILYIYTNRCTQMCKISISFISGTFWKFYTAFIYNFERGSWKQSLPLNAFSVCGFNYTSVSEIDAWCSDLFSHWKAVVPECVCGMVHEQKTPVA